MQRNFAKFVFGLAAFLIGSVTLGAEADSSAQKPKPASGFLTGRMVTIEGSPISNARVWLPGGNPEQKDVSVAETRTDSNGRFRLGPLEPSLRKRFSDLTFEADGYARETQSDVRIFAGAENDIGDVVLWQGRKFRGQVLDFDGKPRANTQGRVSLQRFYLCHTVTSLGEWPVTTDGNGYYETPLLPTGRLGVEFSPPERCQIWVARNVVPGATDDELPPLRLKNDHPLVGLVEDEKGQPIEGADIRLSPIRLKLKSDKQGRFDIRGYGPGSFFQANVDKEGYSFEVKGFAFDKLLANETPNVKITLQNAGWVEGQAVDSETGKPVVVKTVMLCNVVRLPYGTLERSGCRSRTVEPREDGRFRIAYSGATDFVLTLMAEGYHDTEHELLDLKEIKTVEVGAVKLRKKDNATTASVPRQAIAGKVTVDSRPLANAWVGLWMQRKEKNLANADVQRGRNIPARGYSIVQSITSADGSYSLDAPFQGDWYVMVEAPGMSPTIRGPLKIELNQNQKLDVECDKGGSIAGRVRNAADTLRGHLWVVAFGRNVYKTEVRVANDGTFRLDNLPPGEYGLKVGHEGYEDPELPWGDMHFTPKSAYETLPTPWKNATIVKVELGGRVDRVELDLPK